MKQNAEVEAVHRKATLSLYSMVDRVGKLCRKDNVCDGDKTGLIPVLGLLFREAGDGDQRVRMTDVSRHLLITKPAATQAVNRLVERGLVERVSDESDRRLVYIRPTEKGKELFEKELEKKLAFTDRVVARMGEENANQLVELLDRFLTEAWMELGEN